MGDKGKKNKYWFDIFYDKKLFIIFFLRDMYVVVWIVKDFVRF